MDRGTLGRPPARRGGSRLVVAAVMALVSAPAVLSMLLASCAPAAHPGPPAAELVAPGDPRAAGSEAPAPGLASGAPRGLTPEARQKLVLAVPDVRALAERELSRKGIPGLAFAVVAGGEVLA